MIKHTHAIQVRHNECDPMGIVFNGNFLVYADVAVAQLWAKYFGSWENLVEKFSVEMVLVSVTLDFKATAAPGDVLDVTVEVTSVGNTSISITVDITRGSTKVLTGVLHNVCLEAGTTKKKSVPDELRAAIVSGLQVARLSTFEN